MKTIRELQYERIREVYQDICRATGRVPSLDDIRNLALQTIYASDRTPMSGNYRLPSHDVVNVASLNAELGSIKADAEALGSFFDELQTEMRSIRFVSEVWDWYARAKIQDTVMAGIKLAAPAYIDGFTENLGVIGYNDPDTTTASLTADGMIGLPIVAGSANTYVHSARDISIQRIGENLEVSLQGEPLGVVNKMPFSGLLMRLTGHVIEEAGFRVIVNTDMHDINYIGLRLAEEAMGIKVTIQVTSNRKDYKTVFQGLTKWEWTEASIEPMDITQIVVEFTMNAPNIVYPDRVIYEFMLHKILMAKASIRTSARYQTKKVDIESDVSYLSVAVEEERIGHAAINYYIARSVDTAGKPTGFAPLDVRNGQLIEMGNVDVQAMIEPPEETPLWTIAPERRYGSALYNIVNCGMSLQEGDLTIESGTIACSNLVDESVKLYRGVGDWIKCESKVTLEKHVESLSYETEIDNQTAWVKPVPLMLTVKELIEDSAISSTGDLTRNTVKLGYTPYNLEEVRITFSNGTEYYAPITNCEEVTGSWYLTFAMPTGAIGTEVFDPNEHYYISYATTLKEYADTNVLAVTLDFSSFEIVQDTISYVYGSDYQIYSSSFMVELLKTGRYYRAFQKEQSTSWISGDSRFTNKSPGITIKYRFTEESSDPAKYYETNVLVENPVDIVLVPFTESERSAGNFHRIDGMDVSSFNSYPLSTGWHTLQSTQPYPAANEYDVNDKTGVSSPAGIIIPASINTMRVYRDPMRRVSPFVLASLPADEASKCFAFAGGKILLNAQPDFVDDEIVYDSNMSYAKGKNLICKRPIIESDLSNSGYLPQPERFLLEFKYGTATGASRSIWLRVDLSVDDTVSVARVRQIGLNKFREVK